MLGITGRLLSVYCALNYKWSPTVRLQLSKRFPLFYALNENSVEVSSALIMKDVLEIVAFALVIRQLVLYRATKNINQGVSLLCISVLILVYSFAIFTYACAGYNLPYSDSGRFGVFYIEHINYLWIAGNIADCVKYVPQLSLNWMGLCTRGLSSKFVLIGSLSELIALIDTGLFPNNTVFYKRACNLTPIPVTLLNLCFLAGILYQAQFLYFGYKPSLPRGK